MITPGHGGTSSVKWSWASSPRTGKGYHGPPRRDPVGPDPKGRRSLPERDPPEPIRLEPLNGDPLGSASGTEGSSGRVEGEGGGRSLNDAEPEVRLVQRAGQVADQNPERLARLGSQGCEGHELAEAP